MELTFPSQGSKYLKLEKESNAGGGQDMISKMPDCILSYILSFLPTKQIIQTALLSRRWQYLWTSISNIDLYDESSIQSKSSFLDFVERVLLLHDASDIKRFRLNICVSVNPSRINSWVSTVVMHKVQELHLSLPYKISFRLPCCLFTCASLAFLKLDMDLLVVPTSVELPRLKRLDLFGVMFPDDNSIERFLSKCPVLEELNFRNCGWVNTKRITIFIPSLREFTIYNDFYPLGLLDCTIEIYASNLVSLSYESDLRVNCLLQDLPSSVDASIDLFYAREERTSSARRLFDCFLNVKSLTLTGGTLQYLPLVDNLATQHIVARLPTFINMTTLEVNLAVSTSTTELVMGFLQNTPNLQLLVVNFTEIEIDHEFTEDWDHEVVPSCFGSCLKTINTYCFDGYEEDVYLVKFLLKKTTVLERMSIYCTGAFWSNSEKQEQVSNKLQMFPRGSERCVVELL